MPQIKGQGEAKGEACRCEGCDRCVISERGREHTRGAVTGEEEEDSRRQEIQMAEDRRRERS